MTKMKAKKRAVHKAGCETSSRNHCDGLIAQEEASSLEAVSYLRVEGVELSSAFFYLCDF
ncbi:hypothetical protein ANCCAN_20120 [Ancylostoma caninum]|uniref:Uncharacterized protein n=1 Tax=Ancylostoma caninum TaxID=29170 RepID=A0A368FPH3_ANCCA|nr:hypothetical protein ANCCAN_20120 [Ancylostoma caninum]